MSGGIYRIPSLIPYNRRVFTHYIPTTSQIIEQEGFRFRNDDGSEAAATWKAAQDISTSMVLDANTRLRFIINMTGDVDAQAWQLEYKRSTESTSAWCKVTA